MDLQKLLNGSKDKLDTVHPAIREKGYELIKQAHAEGIYIVITQGLRTIEYQNELYAQGRTKAGSIVTQVKGGYSYHNYGLAIDFAVYAINGRDINWTVDSNWHRVGAIGESLGMEWGGSWADFVDIPHFQITFGLSIANLRSGMQPPQELPMLYTAYQGEINLGSFYSFNDAVQEAEKWAGSFVAKISDGSWVWTNPVVESKQEVVVEEPQKELRKLDTETVEKAKMAIDELAEAGILEDPQYWKDRVEENLPVWAYMIMESRKLK
jgi:hypothetical protein